ncbi:hypothetical protein [Thermoflexibacter ruber]|uniref:Uncharacterized protein n=1 Tax=Thermoflexibacter ruber TaxID=1003 RepID=A0A1I2IUT4_9BACT|nr:hypothetical protein [Thermoflexibacter ruber]SFF46202.1 hypothetical protein SAMN04488541_103731 [Thermoflexibacter ruber]
MKEEQILPIPANMEVEEFRNSLTIKYKWSKLMGYALLVFSVIWNSFIFFGFIMNMIQDGLPFFVYIFMLPFIGVGVFMFYYGLAGIMNQTIITVSFDSVNVKHTPLPWVGNKEIFKYDIKQLYVKQHIHRGKNGTSYTYSVNIIDKANKDIKLVDNLQNPSEASFIEKKMEQFLKIEDKPVSGEYKG